eukprot:gene14747-16912_t
MSLNHNDLKRLKKVFDFIDDEKQGSVSINKVLDFLFVGKTRFNKRLFSTLDKDRTGTVDFYSFIVSLWKFLPLESTSINDLVFEMYDTDADGRISLDQIDKMFKDMFGEKGMEQEMNKNSHVGLVDKANYEGFVNIKGFQAFCKTRQMFLSPVFNVQKCLQQATLGVTGWENIAKRSIEVHVGRCLTVRELLALHHHDRALFKNLLDTDMEVQLVSPIMQTVLTNSVNTYRYVSTISGLSPGTLTVKTSSGASTIGASIDTSGGLISRENSPKGPFSPILVKELSVGNLALHSRHSSANNLHNLTPNGASSSKKNARKTRRTFEDMPAPTPTGESYSYKSPSRRATSAEPRARRTTSRASVNTGV